MAKNPSSKYKKNDVFVHKETKQLFIVNEVDYVSSRKKHLYTLKETVTQSPTYKRYYNDKMKDKLTKVKNDKAIKVLYGKK